MRVTFTKMHFALHNVYFVQYDAPVSFYDPVSVSINLETITRVCHLACKLSGRFQKKSGNTE